MFYTVCFHYKSNRSSSYKTCKTQKNHKENKNPSWEPHLFAPGVSSSICHGMCTPTTHFYKMLWVCILVTQF